MADEKQIPFINRRLVWLEDFKATVEPIDSRIRWAQDGIKSYGLLLVKNMFVVNAGALVAAPAYATAIKEKSELLGILSLPISFYIGGLMFAFFCGVSAYYNFSKSVDAGFLERNIEAYKLNDLHFPANESEALQFRKQGHDSTKLALDQANRGIVNWYRLAHGCGWASFICFVLGSVVFMWKLTA